MFGLRGWSIPNHRHVKTLVLVLCLFINLWLLGDTILVGQAAITANAPHFGRVVILCAFRTRHEIWRLNGGSLVVKVFSYDSFTVSLQPFLGKSGPRLEQLFCGFYGPWSALVSWRDLSHWSRWCRFRQHHCAILIAFCLLSALIIEYYWLLLRSFEKMIYFLSDSDLVLLELLIWRISIHYIFHLCFIWFWIF